MCILEISKEDSKRDMDNINGLMVPLIEDNIIRVLDKEKGSILMLCMSRFGVSPVK